MHNRHPTHSHPSKPQVPVHPDAALWRLAGDYLSQTKIDGGLGLGTTVTSVIFLLAISSVVAFLTVTKKDRIEGPVAQPGLA